MHSTTDRVKERPKSAFYATRGECSPSRRPARPHPLADVLPTVRMRGKKRHGGGGAEGRRTLKATTTAPCTEGPSSRLFAVQSVKELGRGRKEDGDDYGVDGGGEKEEEEEEEEVGALGAPVTAGVDPMMPGRVSPPPRRPGAKWPGFLVNRSVVHKSVLLATFSESPVSGCCLLCDIPLHV